MKLNVSVLHDANYIKTMNDFLNNSRILQNVLETLKYIFFKSLIYSFKEGKLFTTQNCSILSLIYKKGSLEEQENYRPISLTTM